MLGSHPISAILGAQITATAETPDIRAYLKGLSDVGLHILFCKPGTKEPLDLRSAKQIKDDNTEYQDSIRALRVALGQPFVEEDIEKLEAPGGVHLATNDLKKLRLYVNKFRKAFGDGTTDKEGKVRPIAPVTMAVSVGPSKLLVVDCDTAAQREAFGSWMAEKSGRPELAFTTPTILSPGVCKDGEWVHRDGGHYYFAVEEGDLPQTVGSMYVEHNGSSFDIFWKDRYILIPPSERSEGKYERVGPVLSLSDHLWFKAAIHEYAESRKPKERDEDNQLPPEAREGLIEWYNNTSWASLLEPHGWERTGDDTACGCEQWGRPGRSSDKSATGHVPGCNRAEYMDSPDPPIHFWTRFPGRDIENKLAEVTGQTLSKLQLFSALDHGGHDFIAMNNISELPSRSPIRVLTLNGVKVSMSTDMFEFDPDDDFDPDSNVIDAPNMGSTELPYANQPSAPLTPVWNFPQPVQTPPTPAIQPATEPTSHTHVHTHVVPVFGMSSSSSENLVEPAGSNIIAANAELPNFATDPATEVATNYATAPATGVATQSATVASTPRYEPSYEQTQIGSPWDADPPEKSTEQIVQDTIKEMTPVITASVVEALKASGVIPC